MPTVHEVHPSHVTAEFRHGFKEPGTDWDHVVVSGEIDLLISGNNNFLILGETDDDMKWYEIHVLVGPWWRSLSKVVPYVSNTGFINFNADEDNKIGWAIANVRWARDGDGAPHPEEERVRLEFDVGVQGELSKLFRLSYHVTAAGRRLGDGGIDEPGPVQT